MAKNTQKILTNNLSNQIAEEEKKLIEFEGQIQKEKSYLGSIIANNREGAPLWSKVLKTGAGILFGISLPYIFTGEILFSIIAFSTAVASYGVSTLGSKLDKHDKIWRNRCLTRISKLKNLAKESKVKLFELYKTEKEIKNFRNIAKDEMLKKEIKQKLQKESYKKVQKKFINKEESINKIKLETWRTM